MDIENLKQLGNIIIELTNQKDSIKKELIELSRKTKHFNNIVSLFGIRELAIT